MWTEAGRGLAGALSSSYPLGRELLSHQPLDRLLAMFISVSHVGSEWRCVQEHVRRCSMFPVHRSIETIVSQASPSPNTAILHPSPAQTPTRTTKPLFKKFASLPAFWESKFQIFPSIPAPTYPTEAHLFIDREIVVTCKGCWEPEGICSIFHG